MRTKEGTDRKDKKRNGTEGRKRNGTEAGRRLIVKLGVGVVVMEGVQVVASTEEVSGRQIVEPGNGSTVFYERTSTW